MSEPVAWMQTSPGGKPMPIAWEFPLTEAERAAGWTGRALVYADDLDAMTKERDEARAQLAHFGKLASEHRDELDKRIAELVELDEQSKTLLAAECELVEKQDKRIAELEESGYKDACNRDDWRERAEAAEARIKALEEALTPSGETKSAYWAEFKTEVKVYDGYDYVTVSWTAIKEIMKAIRDRAALASLEPK